MGSDSIDQLDRQPGGESDHSLLVAILILIGIKTTAEACIDTHD
jgi:hypothetical protein